MLQLTYDTIDLIFNMSFSWLTLYKEILSVVVLTLMLFITIRFIFQTITKPIKMITNLDFEQQQERRKRKKRS